ncbi:MAG: HD domain-containing protein [Planctomycetaceae bacterium]|nr:HD domain-containing protein [Planctomycetaceae bacterium]
MPASKTSKAASSLFPETSNGSTIVRLCDLEPGQLGDCFALLSARERSTTRDGKPYFRCTFRDARRSATAMIWSDTPFFADCEQSWQAGRFYKLRCRYTENSYGPQIDLDRIREVTDGDGAEGFDPGEFLQSSRFDLEEMYAELTCLVESEIENGPLRQLVAEILVQHADAIKTIPAAMRNHHAYRGGFLEHVVSVTRLAVHLADKYRAYYADMQPPLDKSLVVAGAVLHDIGKLAELDPQPQGASYTAQGRLIGHILLGRDLVRDTAATIDGLDPETLLRLEHIIVAHQNLPEWGSPIAPHTPEALLVHYADDIDAKFHMMAAVLESEPSDHEEFTSRDNPLRRHIFRGL